MNTDTLYINSFGTIYSKVSPRGRKLQFVVGGPSLFQATRMIRWTDIGREVFEWHGEIAGEPARVSLVRQS